MVHADMARQKCWDARGTFWTRTDQSITALITWRNDRWGKEEADIPSSEVRNNLCSTSSTFVLFRGQPQGDCGEIRQRTKWTWTGESITALITWRKEEWRKEVFDVSPSEVRNNLCSTRPTLELFRGQPWGDCGEMRRRTKWTWSGQTITALITWRKEEWRKEMFDIPPSLLENNLCSTRPTLELFRGQPWGDCGEMRQSTYGHGQARPSQHWSPEGKRSGERKWPTFHPPRKLKERVDPDLSLHTAWHMTCCAS